MSEHRRLKKTALHSLHSEAAAKMVPFAGYDMPVSYPSGIIDEHLHTREKAGLFDVSHMGQIAVSGADAALHLESLIPVDIVSLGIGRQKYGLLLNRQGGVIDDLMIARTGEEDFILVVNAACKENDFNHLRENSRGKLNLEMSGGKSLLALQGPTAADVMKRLGHDLSDMGFMSLKQIDLNGASCLFSRSGYTGEDGFEISMADADAVKTAALLLQDEDVKWIGLGARDSLRMEAGLPLYGHEITESTTPVEANLLWAISKSRRKGGERPGGFPGDRVVLEQMPKNVSRLLVGLQPTGRAPVREGAILEDGRGQEIGAVTSGGFSPSLGRPICIGFVDIKYSDVGTGVNAVVRDRRLPLTVVRLPFVERRYYRKA